jgi:hypothetical protein
MAMQITEINNVTKQSLAVSETTNAAVGQIAGDAKEILSSKISFRSSPTWDMACFC